MKLFKFFLILIFTATAALAAPAKNNLHEKKQLIQKKIQANKETAKVINEITINIYEKEGNFRIEIKSDSDDYALYKRLGSYYLAFMGKQKINIPKMETKQFQIATPDINEVSLITIIPTFDLVNVSGTGKNLILDFSNNEQSRINKQYFQIDRSGDDVIIKSNTLKNAVSFVDPDVGDYIYIITANKSERLKPQKFPIIQFEESINGAVFSSFDGKIALQKDKSGYYIPFTSWENVAEASKNVKVALQVSRSGETKITPLIPSDINTFKAQKHYLLEQISDSKYLSPERMEFAKFYLQNEMYFEAKGIMDNIAKDDPNYIDFLDARLIYAICLYQINHYAEAQDLLQIINLNYLPFKAKEEVVFWLAVANSSVVGNNVISINFLEFFKKYGNKYPENLLKELAFKDLALLLAAKDNKEAENVINFLKNLSLDHLQYNLLAYYSALLQLNYGVDSKAIETLQKLTELADDSLVRTVSTYDLVRLRYANNEISLDQAIEELNKVRIAWRGDKIEYNNLNFLAQLYFKKGDYIEALRVKKELVTKFPNSGDSLIIAAEMSKIFLDLFTNPEFMKKISDAEAVALYYEFRELTPIGKAGDDIVSQLTIRLINLDLLSRAQALLEHQVKYRFVGEERLSAILKLSYVYLLDRKPQLAYENLDAYKNLSNLEWYQYQRLLLTAKALIDMDRSEDALDILANSDSQDADDLKLEANWRLGEFKQVQNMLEPGIYDLKSKAELDNAEKIMLFRLTICYSMNKQPEKIKTIIDDFGSKFKENEQILNNIKFLYEVDNSVDYRNLDGSVDASKFEKFMEDFKKNLTNNDELKN